MHEHFQCPEVMGTSDLSRYCDPWSPFKRGSGVAGGQGGGWKYSTVIDCSLGMFTVLSLIPALLGVGWEKLKNDHQNELCGF